MLLRLVALYFLLCLTLFGARLRMYSNDLNGAASLLRSSASALETAAAAI